MLFVALAVAPPFVGLAPRLWIMEGFSWLCHQLPHRSFQAAGSPVAVCHRCTGIYVGIVGGALLYPLVRPWLSRWLRPALIATAGVMLLDWGVGVLGIWANTVFTQTATGLAFGIAVGWAVTQGVSDLLEPASTENERDMERLA